MEYIKSVLGIWAEYYDSGMPNLPNYIHARYRLQEVLLESRKAVFVYPKTELEAINTVKKHLERIEHEMGAVAVLKPQRLTYRQKEYLLRSIFRSLWMASRFIFHLWRCICRSVVIRRKRCVQICFLQHSYCSFITSIRDAVSS